MKLIVLCLCLILFNVEAIPGDLYINGVRHYTEVLFENLPSNFNPYSSLAVDYSTNDLYVAPYDSTLYSPVILNLNTRENKIMSGIEYPQSTTFDRENNDVYVGAANGIFKYSQATNESELVGAQGVNVWRVYHFKGVLYYSKYNTGEIYTLIDGQSVLFDVLDLKVRKFVIDNEKNIVYLSYNNKLYSQKKGLSPIVLYDGIPDVNSLTTDIKGTVYFSTSDGIYTIKDDYATVERVVPIDNLKDLVLDNEYNIIYFNNKDNKIYRLKPIVETTTSQDQEQVFSRNENSLSERIDNLAQLLFILQGKVDNLQADVQKLKSTGRDNYNWSPYPVNSQRGWKHTLPGLTKWAI